MIYVRLEPHSQGVLPQEYDFDGNKPIDGDYEAFDSEDKAIVEIIRRRSRHALIFDPDGVSVDYERKLLLAHHNDLLRGEKLSVGDTRKLMAHG